MYVSSIPCHTRDSFHYNHSEVVSIQSEIEASDWLNCRQNFGAGLCIECNRA